MVVSGRALPPDRLDRRASGEDPLHVVGRMAVGLGQDGLGTGVEPAGGHVVDSPLGGLEVALASPGSELPEA